MFKQILIPISSEFYRTDVLERAAFLAEKFGSIITLVYIIEEKTLQQADKQSDTFRTYYDRNTTKEGTIETYKRTADSIIFQDARRFFKNAHISFEEKVSRGEFSTIINEEIKEKPYDLILMGFEKACVLNYRLMDDLLVDIPIWAVSNIQGDDSILAVCSNLAPNQKVPDLSIALAKKFGWKLQMLYVVDTKDTVEVDTTLGRSTKKSEQELCAKGSFFVEQMQKQGIDAKLVTGSLEKEMMDAADALKAKLIIVGRQQKKKGTLGFPVKKMKRKLAEKCHHSILFVN